MQEEAACRAGCAEWEEYAEQSRQRRRQRVLDAGGLPWWLHPPPPPPPPRCEEEEEEEEESAGGVGGVTVTLVVAAVNANRPRHYSAGDSSFRGDYLWSLKQVPRPAPPGLLHVGR